MSISFLLLAATNPKISLARRWPVVCGDCEEEAVIEFVYLCGRAGDFPNRRARVNYTHIYVYLYLYLE